jgi:antitoxin (DNA-binding transcriptional repressor) of toxin-antitoxin stability system
MRKVTIHEAKTHLSRLIQEALNGQEIVITKGRKPLVRLDVLPEARAERRLDGAKGVVEFVSEDFDAALPDFREYME